MVGFPSRARADVPQKKGAIVISLERLVPVISYAHDRSVDTTTSTLTTGNPPGSYDTANVARFGLDVLVMKRLSLGAAMSMRIATGSPSNAPGDDPLVTLVAFSPRVGYFIAVAPEVGFWPRAGLTLSETFTRGYDGDGSRFSESRRDMAASFDVAIVASPIRVLGVVLGIGTNLPLAGWASRTDGAVTKTGSASHADLTISGGFLAHF